jgi:hypothetical protein
VKHIDKQWLGSLPWDRVLTLNRCLCDTQKTTHELKGDKGAAVREMWEKSTSQRMSLFDALDLCRKCCDLAPFVFNNGNTFATLGKTICEEWINRLPSVEGQIVRTSIGHYVADRGVGRKELQRIIQDFGARWQINGHDHPEAAAAAQIKVPMTDTVRPPVTQT